MKVYANETYQNSVRLEFCLPSKDLNPGRSLHMVSVRLMENRLGYTDGSLPAQLPEAINATRTNIDSVELGEMIA